MMYHRLYLNLECNKYIVNSIRLTLNLKNCRIKCHDLSYINKLQKLEKLNLECNSLDCLEPKMFIGLINLNELILSESQNTF